MSFLGPIYLWLLPLVSVPLIIYLLNRRKTKNIYYSTLRFLKYLNKDSIKKINFINNLLLVIRTLIVLLFIIMFTRPTLSSSNLTDQSPSLYILIDNSYSMHGIIDKHIKKEIRMILGSFDKSSNIKIILLDDDFNIIYNDQLESLDLKSLTIDKSLSNSSFKNLDDIIRDDININKNIFILSDGQNYLIEDIRKIENFNELNISYLKLENNIENLSINKIQVNNEVILPGQIFTISTLVRNTGNTDINNAQLDLYINNIKVGQKYVDVPKSANKEVRYEINLPSYGEHLCEIRFEGNDDIDVDDIFYSRFYIQEDADIDIISNEENIFIKNILSSYNYEDKKINMNDFNLDSYLKTYYKSSILIINGLNNLNKKLLNQLYDNSFTNYKIIIFPIISDSNFNNIDSFLDKSNFKKSQRKTVKDDTFFELDLENIQNSRFNRTFSKKENRNIKIFNYISSEYDENTLIKLKNNDFLLNKYEDRNLEIYLFSISMNLESSNFPLKGSSLSLIKNVITNNDFIKYYNIDMPLNIMSIEKDVNLISPSNNIFYNNRNLSNSTKLSEVGFYKTESESSPNYIPVNLSNLEFNSAMLNITSIDSLFGNKIYSTNSIDDLLQHIKNTNYKYDLWRIILYIILLLLSLEMYLCTRIKNNE